MNTTAAKPAARHRTTRPPHTLWLALGLVGCTPAPENQSGVITIAILPPVIYEPQKVFFGTQHEVSFVASSTPEPQITIKLGEFFAPEEAQNLGPLLNILGVPDFEFDLLENIDLNYDLRVYDPDTDTLYQHSGATGEQTEIIDFTQGQLLETLGQNYGIRIELDDSKDTLIIKGRPALEALDGKRLEIIIRATKDKETDENNDALWISNSFFIIFDEDSAKLAEVPLKKSDYEPVSLSGPSAAGAGAEDAGAKGAGTEDKFASVRALDTEELKRLPFGTTRHDAKAPTSPDSAPDSAGQKEIIAFYLDFSTLPSKALALEATSSSRFEVMLWQFDQQNVKILADNTTEILFILAATHADHGVLAFLGEDESPWSLQLDVAAEL